MPFKSKAQARFMFAEHPKMAKEWASKTPNMKALPKYSGRGTKARLNTAASKMFFRGNSK
jgi:hypothetical protein